MTLRAAFLEQSRSCRGLGSPFTADLLALLADHLDLDQPVFTRLRRWEGSPTLRSDAVPLRIAGALHAIARADRQGELAAVYPPHEADPDRLRHVVLATIRDRADALLPWLDRAPQTNEVARSACLIAAGHWLGQFMPHPIRLSELGASAGLNLHFDRYALRLGGRTLGPPRPVLTLAPENRGAEPTAGRLTIAERRGVDLHPVDVTRAAERERLLAYLWPDQSERIARTERAITHAAGEGPLVDAGDAAPWLATRLRDRKDGQLDLVFHTVAWQYFPEDTRNSLRRTLEQTGAEATSHTPIAWLSMEADDQSPGAAMSLRLWPGNHFWQFGRIDFHGRWLDWHPPDGIASRASSPTSPEGES